MNSVTEKETTVTKDEAGAAELKDVYELITVDVSVRKVWKDDGNRDGKRPASLQVKLLVDGEVLKTVSLSDANQWMYTEKDLRKCKADGTEIKYTWKEVVPAGYTQEASRITGTLTTLTNTYGPEKTSISVRKVWDDKDDAAKKRPKEIEVQLFADGTALDESVKLNAANEWKHTWTELDKCSKAGKAIAYTVEEVKIPEGYTTVTTGSAEKGFVITNSYKLGKMEIRKRFEVIPKEETPEDLEALTEVPVVKIWEDNNNKDGNRPASITVHLFEGGKEIDKATLTEAGGWQYTFTDLPKYRDNKTVRYSITEDPVDLYVTEINGYTVVNRYQPPVTSAIVRKVWDDDNNSRQIRPRSVRMTLSNGTSVLLTEANGWTAVVSDLPAIVNGQPATYSWTEQEVPGYKQTGMSVNGNTTTFTNRVVKLVKVPKDKPQPRTPGESWVIFEEYDTALGGEITINHVGDCFD